jgi:hypothetical protein
MAASATRRHPAIDWEGPQRVTAQYHARVQGKAAAASQKSIELYCFPAEGVLPGNLHSNISHGSDPVNC